MFFPPGAAGDGPRFRMPGCFFMGRPSLDRLDHLDNLLFVLGVGLNHEHGHSLRAIERGPRLPAAGLGGGIFPVRELKMGFLSADLERSVLALAIHQGPLAFTLLAKRLFELLLAWAGFAWVTIGEIAMTSSFCSFGLPKSPQTTMVINIFTSIDIAGFKFIRNIHLDHGFGYLPDLLRILAGRVSEVVHNTTE